MNMRHGRLPVRGSDGGGGAVLNREVYADRCPDGYALAGDHRRIAARDYETANRHVAEGDDTG